MDIKNVETKGKILLKDQYFNKTTIKMLKGLKASCYILHLIITELGGA